MAFAMARRDAPCTITCSSSLDPVVVDGGKAVVGIGIEVVSRVVVRCGAASVGGANGACSGDTRVDGAGGREGVLV